MRCNDEVTRLLRPSEARFDATVAYASGMTKERSVSSDHVIQIAGSRHFFQENDPGKKWFAVHVVLAVAPISGNLGPFGKSQKPN